MEAAVDDCVDRLERDVARDRHVTQDLAADRVGDERALVADDGVVEPCRDDVRPHRPEHAAGDDDHMRPRGARTAAIAAAVRGRSVASSPTSVRSKSVANARTSRESSAEARPPLRRAAGRLDDVGRDVGDLLRVSELLKGGIAFLPSVTRAVAFRKSGLAWSRFVG